MSRPAQNPPELRPDLAPKARLDQFAPEARLDQLPPEARLDAAQPRPGPSQAPRRDGQPRIGMVSLGCPKALVDSERILTRLRAEGYAISPDYAGADAVIVNTCGFLDSARAESLEAIGEALRENGRVVVTGCLGAEPDMITGAHPTVTAVTGPHQYEQVLDAVHAAVPPSPDPFVDLLPASQVTLTPRHFSYLKISEGCNHRCRFCIIPDMRGRLASRPHAAVMREAERLVDAGVKELLVISQDTSAYGVDRGEARAIVPLARDLGSLGAWVRLHYVYPYPYVRDLVPLMAEGLVLPYLDVPFQHAHPDTLRRMARPAAAERTLDRIAEWRAIRPDIAIRSTFIVGFPGETEAEFRTLLDWLEEARLDRVGAFTYEDVAGARSNALPGHVPEAVKHERHARFMEVAARISAEKLAARVGGRETVIVDAVDADGATCRTMRDAPEVDGNLFVDAEDAGGLAPGDLVEVAVDEASEHDLWGTPVR